MAFSADLRLSCAFKETGAPDFGSAVDSAEFLFQAAIANGVSNGQADLVYRKSYSVAQSVNTDIDLVGALTRLLTGATFSPAKIMAILAKAGAANPGILTLGLGTNPFLGPLGGTTPTHAIAIGGFYAWHSPAGIALTGGASDVLRIASPATVGTYTWDLLVIGKSA